MTTGPETTADRKTTRRVSFYFSAHQDDWQLFMNPSAFRDVLDSESKCVFVHMTAGDAGLGTGNGDRKQPLFLARENGAECAIRFMADSDNRPPIEKTTSNIAVEGHPIYRVSYRNTVAYFLRLPDGNPEGTGYAGTGHQSLKRLADGHIKMMSSIDGTTSYHGWPDIVLTLRSIINSERSQAPSIHLHIPEIDPAINPDDHSDHYMTAKAVLDATKGMTGTRRLHYVGYASAQRSENLSGQDRDIKCAVYAVTLAGVMAFDHSAAWQHYDQAFVGRNYCRVEGDGSPLA